ncbi:MAG: trypsin-like peptidase domain-containing protein [Chloracidobacterium sp.]|nr:trypsin-like peptidase domain-containing protein [Chloracidobacterium sp.]
MRTEPIGRPVGATDLARYRAGLTTEGNGSPVEYDFIGTGFYVGGGYIVSNRHVMQPWEEDDQVKQMMAIANGRARVKRLVIYFPNIAQPFPLKVKELGNREDISISMIDPTSLPAAFPVIPIDVDTDSAAIGKTVVTMGYPSGPDRLLAMVDDDEAKSINLPDGNSRQKSSTFWLSRKK